MTAAAWASTPALDALFDDDAHLARLLRVEAAFAVASTTAGLITAEASTAITRACATLARLDPQSLIAAGIAVGTPVAPVVDAIRNLVPAEHAGAVHLGLTTQDVVDTAAMLATREAIRIVDGDLRRVADALADHADRWRDAPAMARTLLQHALPITIGATFAAWLDAVLDVRASLNRLSTAVLAVQVGGPVGTGLADDPTGRVAQVLAARLGLAVPLGPWHGNRLRIVETAAALAGAASTAGKIAGDLVLLAQSDVGELGFRRQGATSSAMPHKQNPVEAVWCTASARLAVGAAQTLIALPLDVELARAAGAWQAESVALPHLLCHTAAAVGWLADAVDRVIVHPDRAAATVGAVSDSALDGARAAIDRILARHHGTPRATPGPAPTGGPLG